MNQGAEEADLLTAVCSIEFKESVGWAQQPVLVHGVEFYPTAVFEDPRASYQRNVVIVYDIEASAEYLSDSVLLQERVASLVCG